jgi:transcription-repair coupling factor (superfamily II helicase)
MLCNFQELRIGMMNKSCNIFSPMTHLVSNFENVASRLESILAREFHIGQKNISITGCSSPLAVAWLLSSNTSKEINSLPHIVVVPRLEEANALASHLSFLGHHGQVTILPHFDVSPYIGLYPKPQAVAERLTFLHHSQHAKRGDIFIAPIGSLLQKTLPFKALAEKTTHLRLEQDLPENFFSWLTSVGYQSTPMVEDVGQFSQRGGIFDIFSPAHSYPIRLELFGDTISSMRFFNASDQHSLEGVKQYTVIPCKETIWNDNHQDQLISDFRKSVADRKVEPAEYEEALRSLSRNQSIEGIDFLLPFFYNKLASPLEHFSSELNVWILDPAEISRHADQIFEELKEDFATSTRQLIRPPIESLYSSFESLAWPDDSRVVNFSSIDTLDLSLDLSDDNGGTASHKVHYHTSNVLDLTNGLSSETPGSEKWLSIIDRKFIQWKSDGYSIFISIKNKSQAERLRLFLEKVQWSCELVSSNEYFWQTWIHQEKSHKKKIFIIPRSLTESLRLAEEQLIFLREEDLFGKKVRQQASRGAEDFQKQARRLSFGDLKPGDCVVHTLHGIGLYEGLRVMNISGIESEFIQIQYKDKDKLYLPVYRVGQLQKYSSSAQIGLLDKLGGIGWEKTKTKVRGHLRDIASELLVLYAKRNEMHRKAFNVDEDSLNKFFAAFPYDETDDQLRAISDIKKDLTGTKPMDRLICGDVGFGKTEVAMRAAFVATSNKRQVAVLAPTTVLTYQHFETFKKRFAGWNLEIRELNRFVTAADVKKTLNELKEGKVDIIIGTHRLLSKDVQFKDLGLLIVDEEQKFGVTHKERIKKLRAEIDILTMSATPIPRTLNMSLVGVRDLSLINTAPVDRLPTRTFISKWDNDTIRKSITSEIKRGGQIYFIHNRVQSIYSVLDELKSIVPEARIRVGHGQMNEEELEDVMVKFFSHEFDVLLCTTIVESGMDNPRANTMFVDQAHMMGLSQLYQLRGRVGRSKQRAYCYLILPRNRQIEKDAQERLKVIQENTALGSGIRIAQYDLDLRGAGDLLGEEQSGHINAVGYEFYMELLDEAIHQLRGDPVEDRAVDPEINLKVPALIPDNYISDIRLRLSFYKALSEIRNHEDLEKIESELRDQFGELPEPTQNLLGIMLIRAQCKELGIRDISAGLKSISLVFTEKTRITPEKVISLAMRQNKKYSLMPDSRLNIRMNSISWPAVYEELEYLLKL